MQGHVNYVHNRTRTNLTYCQARTYMPGYIVCNWLGELENLELPLEIIT